MYSIFEQVQKINWANWQRTLVLLPKENGFWRSQKIWAGDPGSEKNPIPDPGSREGVKKAPDPGSSTATLLKRMYKWQKKNDDECLNKNSELGCNLTETSWNKLPFSNDSAYSYPAWAWRRKRGVSCGRWRGVSAPRPAVVPASGPVWRKEITENQLIKPILLQSINQSKHWDALEEKTKTNPIT